MARISSPEFQLDAGQKQTLTRLARASIEHGLHDGRAVAVVLEEFAAELRAAGAAFVTLRLAGELRGCVGSIAARRALAEDVAHNAYAAAFQDPRFAPLTHDEFGSLETHISVLSPAEPLRFESEAHLLAQLRPGIDGLILSVGARRSTFLPAVWESLPEPRAFLEHLKQKAGLTRDYWSDNIIVERYTTLSW